MSELFDDLNRAAAGDAAAASRAHLHLLADPDATRRLIALALDEAGAEPDRACIARHRQTVLGESYPLELQEYPVILGADPRYERPLRDALAISGWARRHIDQLDAGALLQELGDITSWARELAATTERIGADLREGLHVLQAQALQRAAHAVGHLEGKRVLEIGPDEGELLGALRQRGALVCGIDLEPKVPGVQQGDFMSAALEGPFDLVIATAVFEHGSGFDETARDASRRLLARLHGVLAPAGAVVLENVAVPPPFDAALASEAGFRSVLAPVPSATHRPPHVAAAGGRSTLLLKGPRP